MTTKRCGHLLGKEVVDTDAYVARIRACAAARERLGDDIVIVARTDALQGRGFDEAVRRLRAAVDAGADMVFLEGMTTREQMEQFPKAVVSARASPIVFFPQIFPSRKVPPAADHFLYNRCSRPERPASSTW